MTIDILMPALSPTMEEGTLAKWLVKVGDQVGPGDVIAEIETDKATMEVEAVDEGKIGKLVVPEGTEAVKVNSVIAVLLGEGESTTDISVETKAPSSGSAIEAEPTSPPKGEVTQAAAPSTSQTSPSGGEVGAKAPGEGALAAPAFTPASDPDA